MPPDPQFGCVYSRSSAYVGLSACPFPAFQCGMLKSGPGEEASVYAQHAQHTASSTVAGLFAKLVQCVRFLHSSASFVSFVHIFCYNFILDVVIVEIHNGKTEQEFVKLFIDDKTKQSSQEVLFDFIADSVSKFIKDRKITKKLPLGFTFSFPVKQESLISGRLIRWTKDFKATGAEGEDVVQLLKDAFDRRGVSIQQTTARCTFVRCHYFMLQDVEVDVVALVNDTTGTQLAVGNEVPDCNIGLILGTGTNACYMESLDAVPKFNGDRKRYSQVIINTEWGAFGDDGKLDKWMTPYDRQLDDEVVNRGQQL